MRTMFATLSLVLLLPALGCSDRKPTTPTEATAEAAPGGGQIDFRPRAQITGPWRGSSNVDTSPRLNLLVSCLRGGSCATNPVGTLATIAAKIRLRDPESGATIGVVPDPTIKTSLGSKEMVLPANEYSGSVVAASPLAAEKSYLIEALSDSDAVLGFPDSSAAEQLAAVAATTTPSVQSISVFTGSAPMVTRVEMTNDPNKPITSVRVRFSEPVEMGSLVTSGFGLRNRTGTAQGCVWSAAQQACAARTSTETTELFDIMLTAPALVSDLKSAQIAVPGAILGSRRTVAEAALSKRVARGLSAASMPSSFMLDMNTAGWSSCSAAGDVVCARELKVW